MLVRPAALWQVSLMPTRKGSIRLFRLFGITVYLHWTWFLIVMYVIQISGNNKTTMVLYMLGLVTLFGIVLMHEFGHQLACRQVGGQTDDIVLWPLGGVAYVSPPQRPGATLWSIAAGPLVNVILYFIAVIVLLAGTTLNLTNQIPFFWAYVSIFAYINLILLKFNLLPIFPLDGGQILRALLWFVFGRATSLLIATIIGFIGIAGLVAYAVWVHSYWLILMTVFILLNCWGGLMQARAMLKMAKVPRREGFACPVCHTAPPQGAIWRCGKCRQPFDTFETQGVCPHCQTQYTATSCPECGNLRPISEWMTSANVPPKL